MNPTQLVSCEDVLARTHIVSLPLNTKFRGVTHREAALIEGTQRVAGQPVWSEFSPFLEYGAPESAAWLAAALEYAFDPALERFAQGSVPVNATVPAVAAERVAEVLARFDGCSTVKIKVAERGQCLADDLARVAAVRELAADARLRIDANGGWSVSQAERALREFDSMGLVFEYVEQPVATIRELAQLRERLGALVATLSEPTHPEPGADATGRIRIAADELVRKADDPLAVVSAGVVDHLIVKAQPLGGVTRAAAIVAASGLTATVSSALDTSVGIVMGAQLAARLDAPHFAAGLGTVSLFAEEVSEPRRAVAGSVSLAPVVPDADALRTHRASGARCAWWHERIRSCYELLSARSQ